MGLLEDEEKVEDVEDWLRHVGIQEMDFKDESLARSNFAILREFIESIRIELLTDFLQRKDQIIRHLIERFSEKFANNHQQV